MTEVIETLGVTDLPAIAALCARSLTDAPSIDELERTLFAVDQPATLLGDPTVGIIATVTGSAAFGSIGQGFVRLLVVAPEQRGRGQGRALLGAGEETLRAQGANSVTTGADAPYYLWPGVDAGEIALLCLLERLKYTRTEANFNMDVDLADIPDDPGGWTVATSADRDDLKTWAARHWGFWEAEMLRALDRDTLVITRDGAGIASVCAYDVNRTGWVGPVASRPDRMGHGAGVAPLLGALHLMRASGRSEAQVAWVGPIVPYARVGATLGRVFFVHRKELT